LSQQTLHPTDTITLRANTTITISFLEALCGELLLHENSAIPVIVKFITATPDKFEDMEPHLGQIIQNILYNWTNDTPLEYKFFWNIYIVPFKDYFDVVIQNICNIKTCYCEHRISKEKYLELIQVEFIEIIVQLNNSIPNSVRPFVHRSAPLPIKE
jgi:hypothetical protein